MLLTQHSQNSKVKDAAHPTLTKQQGKGCWAVKSCVFCLMKAQTEQQGTYVRVAQTEQQGTYVRVDLLLTKKITRMSLSQNRTQTEQQTYHMYLYHL